MTVTLSDWMYRSVLSRVGADAAPGLLPAAQAAGAAGLRDRPEALRPTGRWRIRLETLLKKSGSTSPRRVFRSMLRELVTHDHLPDYSVTLEDDLVVFRNRESMRPRARAPFPLLDPETYNDVRAVAPGYDPYFLEQEWRNWWIDSGCIELQHPDKAFIAFCKKRYERKPNP